ncbi:DUF2130 domain-containing protein [Roseiconus lacunae]|uniref:DUF2130 domain-containing protein n=1 Tax=Roseiconus lacunae TaxID=2605694 RepID=A0ABT7PNX7_9BACT|nr:DUF2130 domain-containing protein [Roseiconus lacunae]MDM4018170.1 DUF2130 domain-containing protein [Roseiconus lacunae]
MANSITCPSCKTEIEINEVMRSQLTAQIRGEMEADVAARCEELDVAKQELERQRDAVEASRLAVEDQVRKGVESQSKTLRKEAELKAREVVEVELKDRDERVDELQLMLKEAQSNELELRKRERDLQSQKEQLQLEVARRLDSEREKIRAEAKDQYEEQHQLKDAEKEKQIGDLRKQIDQLKRKAEQGSQQMQGEVQELALEDLLATSFPADTIEPIAKGVRGGDALHRIFDPTGLNCGGILWESKRTKNWSNTWLAKARDDQRSARAGCVVIVSEALPEGVRTFALIDGVWVCSWACVTGLAAALRIGMIEVGKSKLAVQGQHEKMELVYNYLAGREFRQRVEGVVEAFITMQSDLNSEKRSMQRIWSKREKQLQRALNNTAGLYGDLQGIIGASMPAIEGLTFPAVPGLAEERAAKAIAAIP